MSETVARRVAKETPREFRFEILEEIGRLADVGTRDECWDWRGPKTTKGYSRIRVGGQLFTAHRALFEVVRGKADPTRPLDHLCRNRSCVNPFHLELVTTRENLLRGVTLPAREASQTHCRHGHEYTRESTRMRPSRYGPYRSCLICARIQWAERKRRRALAQEADNAT